MPCFAIPYSLAAPQHVYMPSLHPDQAPSHGGWDRTVVTRRKLIGVNLGTPRRLPGRQVPNLPPSGTPQPDPHLDQPVARGGQVGGHVHDDLGPKLPGEVRDSADGGAANSAAAGGFGGGGMAPVGGLAGQQHSSAAE